MPIIDAIEHGTYHDKAGDYLANNKGEHEKVLTPIKNFLKELKDGELDTIADIKGLDTESLIINKGSPLNQLTKNLQNDIDVFLEEIDPAFSEAFVKEVRTHRDKEATKSYDKEKEWYEKERVKPLQRAIDDYNSGHRKSEYDEETGEYKVQYYKAHLMRTGSLLVDVTYSGGGNTDPRNDAKGRGLISAITAARDKAVDDYYTYVEPVEELKDKYAGTAETPVGPGNLKSIEKADELWNNPYEKSETNSKEKEKAKNNYKDINRDGYETEAILDNGRAGEYVLYSKKIKGKKVYFVEGKDGEMHLAKRSGGGALTEADVTNSQGTIKVETGSKYGEEHFSFSKNEIKDISSVDKDTIAKLTSTNIEREGYKTVATLNNGKAGEYVLYSKKIGEKKVYFVEGKDGEMHLAKRSGGGALTEADVTNSQGTIKVETGSKYGEEHYSFSDGEIEIISNNEENKSN